MKMDELAGSGDDEFYTPLYAVKPIFKYVKEHSTIWCPFDTENSWFVKYGKQLGHNMIYSHIDENKDFFYTFEEADYIISNPPYSCLTPDHEVYTKQGWKPISEIEPNDEIMSVDYNTLQLSWDKAQHKIVKDVDEDVLYFKSKYIDLKVTQDHRMFSYNKFTDKVALKDNDLLTAKDISESKYIPRNNYLWEGTNIDFFEIPGCYVNNGHNEIWKEPLKINMLDWARFLGLWIADGHYRDTLNSQGNQRYSIGIKQHVKTSDKVRQILDKLPFKYSEYISKDNKINFDIHNKQLWEVLSKLGKSNTKFIPNYIKEGTNEILAAFMEGYTFGDSHKSTYKNVSTTTIYSSVSEQLIYDIQEVLLKLHGWLISKITTKNLKNNTFYKLYFNISKHNYRANYPKPQIEHYKGKVYCLTLTNNSVFMVKRNNTISFTGNCKSKIFYELFRRDIPFAMLVGVVGLFESQDRFNMFKNNEFEIMYFNKRIAYFKDYAEQKPSLSPPFSSVYLTHKMLPKQIVFENIDKDDLEIKQITAKRLF